MTQTAVNITKNFDNTVETKTMTGLFQAIHSASRSGATIEYTANILYNIDQSTISYYIDGQKVSEINVKDIYNDKNTITDSRYLISTW